MSGKIISWRSSLKPLTSFAEINVCLFCLCVFSLSGTRKTGWVIYTPMQLRVKERGCQKSIQTKSMICSSVIKPKLIRLWLHSCVSVRLSKHLGQSKQLLLSKCGLYGRSGAVCLHTARWPKVSVMMGSDKLSSQWCASLLCFNTNIVHVNSAGEFSYNGAQVFVCV